MKHSPVATTVFARLRNALLLATPVLLAASVTASANPGITQVGAGNVSLNVTFPLTTSGNPGEGIVAISTAHAVNVTIGAAINAPQSIGVLLGAVSPSALGVVAAGSVSGIVGVDASAHTDLGGFNSQGVTGGLALTNAGTITGTGGTAIQFGSGDDTLTLQTGSVISGTVDGGAGNNTVALVGNVSSQSATQAVGAYTLFQTLNVNSGYWTLGAGGSYPTVSIASGATLEVDNLGLQSNGGLAFTSLSNDGQLVFNTATALAEAGNISGSGNLTKLGAGALTLSGTSAVGSTTVAGGTLILTGTLASSIAVTSGATLQIGAGAAAGDLLGSLVDNGTVNFNRVGNYTFTGAFSGNGALVDNDPGVLTFSGLYSFTGVTTINGGGTINIGQLQPNANLVLNSGVINLTGASSTIASLTGSGGTVNVATGNTVSISSGNFGGNITGGGSLKKVGIGLLDLTGIDTLGGTTEVVGGILQIDGVLTSPVTVDSGAMLGGSGTINGLVTVLSGGVFAPGDPVTTHVVGGVTFAGGSSYLVQVLPTGEHDQIAVTGPVTIQNGASFKVDPLSLATSYGRLTNYTVITATGGVTGTFATVTSDAPLLTPHLSYSANAVQLSLTRNDITLASLAATSNQAAAAAAIDAGGLASALSMALVVQTTAGAQQGYDALSGEIFATLPTMLLSQSDQIRRTLIDRMGQPSNARGIWGEIEGGWSNFASESGMAGAHSGTAGATMGIDDTFDGWRIGLAGTYGQNRIQVVQRMSSAKDKAEGISLYSGKAFGPIEVRLGGGYAWHQIDTSRQEQFPGFNDLTTAGFDAGTGALFGEVGYNLTVDGGTVTPFAGLSYNTLNIQHVTEAGGPAALFVAEESTHATSTRLGVRTALDVGSATDPAFSFYGSLAWRHNIDESATTAHVTFESTHQGFIVDGLQMPKDAAEIIAGVSSRVGTSGRIDLSYSGEIATGAQTNAVKLLASWQF